MKKRLLVPALLLCVGAAPVEAPRILVLDLRSQGMELRDVTLLGEEVAQALRDAGGREVLSQNDVRELLTVEAQRRLLGCGDDECVAEIAGTLGARHVVTGSVLNLGGAVHVRLTLLDTVEGRQVRTTNAESGSISELRDLVRDATFDLVDARHRPRPHREVAWPVNELGLRAGIALPSSGLALGPSVEAVWLHRTGNVALGPVLGWSRSQTSVHWDDLFDPYEEAVGVRALRAGGVLRWPATGGVWLRPYLSLEAGLLWLGAESSGENPYGWATPPVTDGQAFNVYAAPAVGLRLLPRASFGLSVEAGWMLSAADAGVFDRGQPLLQAPPTVGASRGNVSGFFVSGVFSHGF